MTWEGYQMNTKSRLFKAVSDKELRMCSRTYLGEELRSARLLDGGLFNTTYRLETATRSTILRLGPVNREYLLPYERRLMEAEQLAGALLHSHEIPTSTILAVDCSKRLLDRDIMVVDCLPGVSLSTIEVSADKSREINFLTGTLTKKLHGITAGELPQPFSRPYGRIGSVVAGYGGASWSEALRIEVQLWRQQAETIDLFTKEEFDRFEGIFRQFSALFDAGCQSPRLVHADLWAGNLLVDAEGKLLALIDCDRAIFGDPEFEFAAGWLAGEDFCRGYSAWPDASPEGVLRRRLYHFLLNLEDCYVHLGEYNNEAEGKALCAEVLEELNNLERL